MENNSGHILDIIGNTPMVELAHLNGNKKVRIIAKIEGANPGGSVKDRPAFQMITEAEKTGALTREKTIIEPTSGNMGIAMAMIGAAKGYNVTLFMPECVSTERQLVLRATVPRLYLPPPVPVLTALSSRHIKRSSPTRINSSCPINLKMKPIAWPIT